MSQVKFDPLVSTTFTEEEKAIARENLDALSCSVATTEDEKYQLQYNLKLNSNYASGSTQFSTGGSFTGLQFVPFVIVFNFRISTDTKLWYKKIDGYATDDVVDYAAIYTRSDDTFTKILSFDDYNESSDTSDIIHNCSESLILTPATYYLGLNAHAEDTNLPYRNLVSSYSMYDLESISVDGYTNADLPDSIDLNDYNYTTLYFKIFFNLYKE